MNKGYVQKAICVKTLQSLGQEGLGIVYAGADSMKSLAITCLSTI